MHSIFIRNRSASSAMRHGLCISCCLLLSIVLVPHAVANDVIARIGAGGIEFVQSEHIRMLEETLEITPSKVQVAYRFRNESSGDIQATVAFPMPDYGQNSMVSTLDSHLRPVRDFVLTVDGRQLPSRSEKKAFFQGKDVTRELRDMGLSEQQIFENFGRNADFESPSFLESTFTPDQEKALRQRYLLSNDNYWAQWTVQETLLWEQVFPAGRDIFVSHSYQAKAGRCSAGSYPASRLDDCLPLLPEVMLLDGNGPSSGENCIDASICEKLKKSIDKKAETAVISLNSVEYILGTARLWKGPIDKFTLRLVKESPEDVVALCFPGTAVQVDPLTLEYHERNYVPQDRIRVNFYSVMHY